MKISGAESNSFCQFSPWRVVRGTMVRPREAEELTYIRDSINSDPWMRNYDVDGFVYLAPWTMAHPCRRSVKHFVRPAHEYFVRIKKRRPEAKINEYERASIPFALTDEMLEDKIREFLRKQQNYIKHCVHSKEHGKLYKHNREHSFSIENTKPLM